MSNDEQSTTDDGQSRLTVGLGGWQPIETAPKDGRTMLLGRWNAMGLWRTMRGRWFTQEQINADWEEPDDAEPGWYETAVEPDPPNCWAIYPAYWMPLPKPPNETR